MKKIQLKSVFAFLSVITIMSSCSVEDKIVDQVFAETERGAILRTLDFVSTNFNREDTNSFWAVTIEEQDQENGDLLSAVNVYVSFTDNKDDGMDFSKPEQLVTTFAASDFTSGENGLPVVDISATLGETIAALGLSDGQFDGGDIFGFRLEVVLTDGRTYSSADASGNIASGSFFQSPYLYSAGVLCIPATPFPGDYTLDLVDTYGDGWDGAFLTVTLDGVSTEYTAVGTGNTFVVSVPPTATELIFNYTPGAFEGEHVLTITRETTGNVVFNANPPTPGVLGLDLCLE